ncbi:MAG: agmatine deiminase family protein, partial [Planctomycetota bacterium]
MTIARALPGLRPPTPHDQGYRWPAEWEPHQATWLAWPHDPTTFGEGLGEVENAYLEMARAIGPGETVHVTGDAQTRKVAARFAEARIPRARVHAVSTRDAWIRDTGPIVVKRGRSRERLALDFRFDAWSGKYPDLVDDDD